RPGRRACSQSAYWSISSDLESNKASSRAAVVLAFLRALAVGDAFAPARAADRDEADRVFTISHQRSPDGLSDPAHHDRASLDIRAGRKFQPISIPCLPLLRADLSGSKLEAHKKGRETIPSE